MRRFLALALALALAASAAFAAANDRIPVNHVRFPATSSRVMALTSGALDGAGFGRASLDILSTATATLLYGTRLTADAPPNDLRSSLLGTSPLLAYRLVPGAVLPARYKARLPAAVPAVE